MRQQEIRQQNQKQYWLLNELLRTRLESWVELFIQLHQKEAEEIQSMADTLADKMDFLHLNWQVEHLWLADSDGEVVFSTQDSMPQYIQQMQRQVLDEQRSIENIHCEEQCVQALSLPILTSRGELAVISMSLSLLETLAFLNQSTDADLAQVFTNIPTAEAKASDLVIRGPLSRKTQELIQTLIDRIPSDYRLNLMLSRGVQVSIGEQEYMLNLITMTTTANDGNYVLSAHDITPMMQAHRQYQQTVLLTIGSVIFIAGVLIYLLINSLRRRLLRLSEQLPLLAQRDYKGFNALSIRSKRLVGDELDTLQDSAIALANRLETLDTEVADKTRELERIAMYDSLTELPNRNMLTYQLNLAIDTLRRRSGIVVILFFDLDDFKKVNDSYGHGVGDALLCEASNRLKMVLRKSDIACRFGGDEFVVMLNHLDDLEGAIRVADKILESFVEPIHIDNLRFYVSTSLGIAATDNADISAEDLIRHADVSHV